MFGEDEKPAPKPVHQVGQDLSTLSLDELGERIELLREEIRRIERMIEAKTHTRAAAEQLFRSP